MPALTPPAPTLHCRLLPHLRPFCVNGRWQHLCQDCPTTYWWSQLSQLTRVLIGSDQPSIRRAPVHVAVMWGRAGPLEACCTQKLAHTAAAAAAAARTHLIFGCAAVGCLELLVGAGADLTAVDLDGQVCPHPTRTCAGHFL